MSLGYDQALAFKVLASGRYSACDISDALVELKVPQAGFLPDIVPIPLPRAPLLKPLIAPLSTVLFVPNSGPLDGDPLKSNIPAGKHFTDMPAPGTIVLLQQPSGLLTAVLGDIMATRLQMRGVRGVVANGRVRDIGPIGQLCATVPKDEGESAFTVWSKGTSTVGPAFECKAWCTDVPLLIGHLEVKPGDLLFADETERGVVLVPQEKIDDLIQMLPVFKDKDDQRVADVQAGLGLVETIKRHP